MSKSEGFITLARRRWVSPDSLVHESVEQRLTTASPPYKPRNLPQQRRIIGDSCPNEATSM